MSNNNDEIGPVGFVIIALALVAIFMMGIAIGHGTAKDRCEVSYDNVRENVMEKNDYYVPPVNFDSIWDSIQSD